MIREYEVAIDDGWGEVHYEDVFAQSPCEAVEQIFERGYPQGHYKIAVECQSGVLFKFEVER